MSSPAHLLNDRRQLLERYLRSSLRDASRTTLPTVQRRTHDGPVCLSLAQQQVWLHAQTAPAGVPIYNETVTIRRTGSLDLAVLERALTEIVRRHEIWRTTFDTIDGQPVQVIHSAPTHFELRTLDLRELPEVLRDTEGRRLAESEARQPFDLKRGPLLRATLVRLGEEDHRLFMTFHQLVFDGVAAYRVFLPELAVTYEAFLNGKPSPLTELPIQYADYAIWQREWMKSDAIGRQMSYWRKQLSGELPVLQWPTDRHRPAVQSYRGNIQPFALSSDFLQSLKRLCKAEGATLYMTLVAGLAALLHRYTGQEDIIIGAPTAGRKLREVQSLLGYFLNLLPLRIDLSGNPTFQELLSRVRETVVGALSNDDVPFEHLVEQLRPNRDPSRNPFFQIAISLEPPIPVINRYWNATQSDIATGASKLDLYIDIEEKANGIVGPITYNPDLFDAGTIGRMTTHWQNLLEGTVSDPTRRVSRLPLLSSAERQYFLVGSNDTARAYPQACIHELFELQARKSPESIAVMTADEEVTYGELNARANRLARHLRRMGVGPEDLVALCVERSVDMVVGLLGILKAGAAYIPLDAGIPRERLALMLADARPRLLVTQQALLHRLPKMNTAAFLLDAERPALESESAEDLNAEVSPTNLAYVIYTSGSTGIPKGVQIEHRSVVNLLTSMQVQPGLGCEDVLVAVTTLSFDIAGLELYLPLISGARVAVASADTTRDGSKLLAFLRRSKATVMQATPTTWRMLIEAGWTGAPALKVLCGGEALTPALAQELAKRSESVWNLYGPTETTIWSALHRVDVQDTGTVPIGRPIANTKIYILDRNLNLLPAGTSGEIYIGGDGLARGYVGRTALTAEKFISDPFRDQPGARIYSTGDLGRYRSTGEIECLGRIDQQVKVRGFRVELGEIEAALSRHPSVEQIAAAVYPDGAGENSLAAYVVPRTAPIAGNALRAYASEILPEYMVPSSFVVLDKLPLTPNGKLDRKALPPPEKLRSGTSCTYAGPRDKVESQLCEIWEQILGVKPIGIHDDFFSLGGHSLLAMRLFAVTEKRLGRRIPLSTLLKAPSIAQLANILRDEEHSSRYSWLVEVQPSGSLPPLFCVHGIFGDVLFARELSQRLGPEQPVFALQGRARKGLPAHDTIEAMAADYLAEIRQIQTHGPYLLSGSCFGARVALEMAHQLIAQDEQVALLCLFLGYEPQLDLLGSLRSRLNWHLRQLRMVGATAKLAELPGNLARKATSLAWRLAYRLFRDRLPATSPLFQNIPEMNLVALKKYFPKTYPGSMTVFMNGGVPRKVVLDRQEHLYGMWADEVELFALPGDIGTMFEEPAATMVAGHLKTCIQNAVHGSGAYAGAK